MGSILQRCKCSLWEPILAAAGTADYKEAIVFAG